MKEPWIYKLYRFLDNLDYWIHLLKCQIAYKIFNKNLIYKSACIYDKKILTGKRHHTIIHKIYDNYNAYTLQNAQGFIDIKGNFLTREKASEEAFKNKQIKIKRKFLFSENLYGINKNNVSS